ncbi:PGF-pre-PGF domain-containing protein [Methanococcoides methylutens]|uniref:Cell surface protein n=1 Tax=Methanococcoides methylutens MM1 TaxID=1434104 RepID=A0A0E3SRZ5_METMT|nr:PGF-pre-PGF domain-containing protein [Methanococcoides methylutens]AKB85841.1 Cell surface protein [Methanococcoides methylutens MM1]
MSVKKLALGMILFILFFSCSATASWNSDIYITSFPHSDNTTSPPPPPAIYVCTFGVSENATEGFDKDIDVTAPPVPQVDALESYFPCDHEVVTRLATDIKGENADSWTLMLNVPADSNVSIQWDIYNIPSDKNVKMNTGSETIDMRGESTTSFETGFYELMISLSESRSESTKPSSPNNGGGGGGGGGATGEAFENILVKDAAASNVVAGVLSRYDFSEEKCHIVYIQFKGVSNAGQISTLIEILKDTSTLVDSPAPGIVYQNMNIWVGNAAFGDDKIEDAVIGFRVSKEWLSENGIGTSSIALYRYSDGKWNQLSTINIDEDSEYVYFEAGTPGFSPFVISAVVEEGNVMDSTLPSEEVSKEYVENEDVEDDSGTESNTIPGFSVFLTGVVLVTIISFLKGRE